MVELSKVDRGGREKGEERLGIQLYEGFKFLSEPYQILGFRSFQSNFYGHIRIQQTILHMYQVWKCEIKGFVWEKKCNLLS